MHPLILKGHSRPLTQVKYNSDGDLLFSCSKDSSPTVWFTQDGERLGTFDGHTGTVWSLDVNRASSILLTAGADMTCKIWEVTSGTLLCTLDHSGPVRWVEFAEGDKKFITIADAFSSSPTTVRVYTLPQDTSRPFAPEECTYIQWKSTGLADPRKRLTRATWCAANEEVLTGDEFGVLRRHHPETGELMDKFKRGIRAEIKEHTKKINCLSWNKEKTLLVTASSDHSAKLFNAVDFTVLKTYVTEVPANSAAISPIKEHVLVGGGQEAMAVTTSSVHMGKFETKFFHMVFTEEFGTVKGHFGPVNTIAIHPTGRGFASGAEDGYIRIHEFEKDYFAMHSELDNLDALLEELNIPGTASAPSFAEATGKKSKKGNN